MSFPQRASAAAAAAFILCGAVFALSACSSPLTDPGTDQTQQGQPDDGDTGVADTDGGDDPTQDTVRTGPVAEYGGPAYGDQGDAEVVEPGVWCKTVQIFWGGSVVIPDGVTFTFASAEPDHPGLAVEPGVCGSRGADRTCLGLKVAANESGIVCSIEVRPDADFVDGTTLTFVGTLECPTSAICDEVATRQVDPGPPIVVNTPAGS